MQKTCWTDEEIVPIIRDRYLLPGETSLQEVYLRVATAFGSDKTHSNTLYQSMMKGWFLPSTPILANAGTSRGLPISCYTTEVGDNIDSIIDTITLNAKLSASGGGIGTYMGNIRSIGENIGNDKGTASGIIPLCNIFGSITNAISQGSLRRGSTALYLPIDHPEIMEFLDIRKAHSGDISRRCPQLHHGVCISNQFMHAVRDDLKFSLHSPADGVALERVRARTIWEKLLETRLETGEPFIFFSDHARASRCELYKINRLEVKTSNLCSEIMLTTGKDYNNKERVGVCCLASVNLKYYDQWKNDPDFFPAIAEMLDNVLEFTAQKSGLEEIAYTIKQERSIGVGVMGLHDYLYRHDISFEFSQDQQREIFSHIRRSLDEASLTLGEDRGWCIDGYMSSVIDPLKHHPGRFSNKIAIAPTATISMIAGGVSPGVEPFMSNIYTYKNLGTTMRFQNPYLPCRLTTKQLKDIEDNGGSYPEGGPMFKTAYEMDQVHLLRLAAIRQEYIDQGQSTNLFVRPDIGRSELHKIHFEAWKLGLKSLYYLYSDSIKKNHNHNKMGCNTCQ